MTALFIPYGKAPPRDLKAQGIRVVGTNMSNPPWLHLVPEGVHVVTTPDVPRPKMVRVTPTAEHAWGLLLAAHRRLVPAALNPHTDRNRWMAPWQLCGRRLLVIGGEGRIGSRLCVYGRAFGMEVCGFDLEDLEALGEHVEWANVIMIACTLNPTSEDILKDYWHRIQRDTLLVSIAPWQVLGDPDYGLIPTLEWQAARLRAAAVDDWPPETTVPRELVKNGALIVTPHIAGSTLDARAMTEQFVREEMAAWLERNPE